MKQAISALFMLFVTINANASTPQFKTYTTQHDLEKGKMKGISLTEKGEIQLAPEAKLIHDSQDIVIWDLVADKSGNIFISAGNEGKIYVISNNGNAKLFCQLDEIEIYTMALDSQNRLFAATSPDGKVYHISSDGIPTVYFDPAEKYIWDIIFDKANTMYVATGDSGVIYKIDTSGKSNAFYASDEQHIRCLSWDKNNNLLAGSFGNGYIYRISGSGEAFVIHDSNLKEIHHIEVTPDGTIYAAALGKSFAGPPKPTKQQQIPVPKTEEFSQDEQPHEEDEVIIGEIQIESPQVQPQRDAITESAIFKITPNGNIKNIWDSYTEHVQAIAWDKHNCLLAGTGSSGKLIRIQPNDEKTILAEVDESQITNFTTDPQGYILFATANMGKVYRLQTNYQPKGEYVSEVFDSYVTSKWGSIYWEGETPSKTSLSLYTRTGNTEIPNSTWGFWSPAYANSESENIVNNDSRFIQWKAELTSNDAKVTPALKELSISYLQKNLPPDILLITIFPPGEFYQGSDRNIDISNPFIESGNERNGSTNRNQNKTYLGRKLFRKGFRTVSWDVEDQNDDQLKYTIYYQQQHEPAWKKLVGNWYNTSFAWDTERMPDGNYKLKLEVSDSVSNDQSLTLVSDKISDPFIVDNSGPRIKIEKVNKQSSNVHISFIVTDEQYPVAQVEYAVDGNEWQKAYPIDGVCDSKNEKYTISITVVKSGPHTIVFKATDLINNIGFERTRIED